SCLKEEDRFLFRQLFIEEMEPDEVARKNGIKRENLYNRISRGKKKIRRHFSQTGREKGGADYERFI
ncbi:MAG TPA: RNA polymerase subunit sigma-70, partial [Candidatus Eubacterium avistercoris]|nr:RNA polymerase subunit sigma-70 [Candidatus Eubacterium avistercoris]